MKTTLSKLDQIHAAINFERENYKNAILNNQPFEEVKVIYLKIKSLQKEADGLMEQANLMLKLKKYSGQSLTSDGSGFMVQ